MIFHNFHYSFIGSGFQTTSKVEDEDMDLNVEEDDVEQYGPSQYPLYRFFGHTV